MTDRALAHVQHQPIGGMSPLQRAAVRATLAPSVHNTQPWRLVVGTRAVEVWADRSRSAPVFDPAGRQLLMSCGAATLNARAALAAAGRGASVSRFPDADRPDLVARIELAPDAWVEQDLAALDQVADRRRTNRRPFIDQAVRPELIQLLVAEAGTEAGTLAPVPTREQREAVRLLAEAATRRQEADPAYRAELRAWRTGHDPAGEGLPKEALAHSTDSRISPGEVGGDPAGCLAVRPPHWGPESTLVLSTDSDTDRDWARAGEALQRVLLSATAHELSVGLVASVVEVPETRRALRQVLGLTTHPQLVLRVGFAAPSEPTRRRRLVEVIATDT